MKPDSDFFLIDRTSPDVFKDVALFTEIAQQDMLVPKGKMPLDKAIALAIGLIEEEYEKEYMPALLRYRANPSQENLKEVFDGGLDCIYVIAWAFRVLNLPSQAGWNEVQRSNMAKLVNFDPHNSSIQPPHPLDIADYKNISYIHEVNIKYEKVIIRNADTGKIMKPMGWTPPNLGEVILQDNLIAKICSMPDGVHDRFMRNYFLESEARIKNAP